MAKKSSFNLTQIMSARSMKRDQDRIEGQITIQEWMEWKEDIHNRVEAVWEDYIAIGYRLKQIRDSRAYENDGFSNLHEFAFAEYHFSKSMTNRLCKVNDVFSVGGNSMEIEERYRGFGLSKLQEMLSMTEEEREQVTSDMTVREIRDIKKGEDRENTESEGECVEDTTIEDEYVDKSEFTISEPEEQRRDVASYDDWKEKKPEPKPIELPSKDAIYREKMGKTMLREITEGSKRYIIIKKRHRYREGNTVILMEHDKGKQTGKTVTFRITHMTDDSGGIVPGYCVLGFADFEIGEEEVREEDES